MKKRFTFFLILIFIYGLVPINFSNAITQNLIDAEVQIVCTDGNDNWFSGSGTIIDPKGIILTNRHVVEGAYKNTCFIGFLESINKEPNFGLKNNRNIAEVKYITTTEDMDAAILYLNNKDNKTYPYVNIWGSNSSSLKFGDKVEVVGYPGIGGSTITYTSGDFSGFGSKSDNTHNYIKTTALLEHGNSGGSAYNQGGEFIGIPTMVVTGALNSISYVLSVDSIKKWLSGFLGSNYKQEIIEEKPIIIEQPKIVLQNDITPPSMFTGSDIIFHNNETGKDITWNRFEEGSNITVKWPEASDESGIDGYYVYFGNDKKANPILNGIYTKERSYKKIFNVPDAYFIMIAARDKNGNISTPVIAEYNYQKYPEWVTSDPLQYAVVTNRPEKIFIYDYSRGKKGNLLKTIKFDPSKVQSVSVPSNNLYIEWSGVDDRNFIVKEEIRFDVGNYMHACGGAGWDQNADGVYYRDVPGWLECVNKEEIKQYKAVENSSFTATELKVGSTYNFEIKNHRNEVEYGRAYSDLGEKFGVLALVPTKNIKFKESEVILKLIGKILLQIESHGEAWYVNPKDKKRYYMANGDEAYKIMRSLGVGINNNDLEKIKKNKKTAISHSGKIFLQIENKGEAYYVDFSGNLHYLKNGVEAYNTMRNLGLGITNKDLEKITKALSNNNGITDEKKTSSKH